MAEQAIKKWLRRSGWFVAIGVSTGVSAGVASAALLLSLEWATQWREQHEWILFGLPLAGLFIGLAYRHFSPQGQVQTEARAGVTPLRAAPLVWFGTVATHLFGGSAGREGTAVQMSVALGEQWRRWVRLESEDARTLRAAAVSAGFSSVFGTPIAGAIFGLEMPLGGHPRVSAVIPCALAAWVGNWVTLEMGVRHTSYGVDGFSPFSLGGFVSVVVIGVASGLVSRAFVALTHGVSCTGARAIGYDPLRPVIGGALLVAIVSAFDASLYLGLGIPTIVESFHVQQPIWSFAVKTALTALTIGSGFKGGEATPLFFIGATLGSALSSALSLPIDVLAGLGFVAVFAGASKTPMTSAVMALELFGGAIFWPAFLACGLAFEVSGRPGVYGARAGFLTLIRRDVSST